MEGNEQKENLLETLFINAFVLSLFIGTGLLYYKMMTGVDCDLKPTKFRPFAILTLTDAVICREVDLWDDGDITGRGCLVKRVVDPDAQKCDLDPAVPVSSGTWYRYEILKVNIGGKHVKAK